MKRLALVLATSLVLTVGCGAKDTPTATSSSSTTAAIGPAATTAGTGGGGSSTSAPGTTAPAGCPTTLAIVNGAAATETTLTDRKLDVQTAWSDQGPHPDNTVDYDKTLDVAVAEFEIEKSPQFGYSIPIGDPTITITAFDDDEVCLTFSSVTKTDLQRFMGLEGSVKVTRIQSLEAADTKR